VTPAQDEWTSEQLQFIVILIKISGVRIMTVKIITTDEELAEAYDIRKTVFVKEQHVPVELEIDEFEQDAIHFLCSDNNQHIGASRLRIVDHFGKLERICVLKEARGNNYAKQLIDAMERELTNQGITEARLNAQTYIVPLYESVGYKVVSPEFMDANIPHVEMVKDL